MREFSSGPDFVLLFHPANIKFFKKRRHPVSLHDKITLMRRFMLIGIVCFSSCFLNPTEEDFVRVSNPGSDSASIWFDIQNISDGNINELTIKFFLTGDRGSITDSKTLIVFIGAGEKERITVDILSSFFNNIGDLMEIEMISISGRIDDGRFEQLISGVRFSLR